MSTYMTRAAFSYEDLSPKQLHAWRTEELETAIASARWSLETLNKAHPLDIREAFSKVLEAGVKLGRAKSKLA